MFGASSDAGGASPLEYAILLVSEGVWGGLCQIRFEIGYFRGERRSDTAILRVEIISEGFECSISQL